jgi:hypothetical protein
MTNYSKCPRFFEDQIERLGVPFVVSFATAKRVLSRCTNSDVDEVCRAFAQTGMWPAMSDEARFEVCLRLDCARAWCVLCGSAKVDPRDECEPDFLKELLLDYWNDGGRAEWIRESFVCKTD